MLRRFILIPHLKIHNANALSSPFTIGFPAMTAWLGGVHALQRKLNQNGFPDVIFSAVAVSCHDINLQVYKGPKDYDSSLILTRNPLDKDGKSPSIIEEARCHLNVSLLIEFKGVEGSDIEKLVNQIPNHLQRMKFASGDILDFNKPQDLSFNLNDDNPNKITNKLMLGNVLVSRNDLMREAMKKEGEKEGKDALDAILDYLKIYHQVKKNDDENDRQNSQESSQNQVEEPEENDKEKKSQKIQWQSYRKTSGWIVPIAIGFHGISDLGFAKNQRDPETPHRFAESVVTLGQFIMPYRIKNIDEMLWHYEYQEQNNLYLCKNIQQFKPKINNKGEQNE